MLGLLLYPALGAVVEKLISPEKQGAAVLMVSQAQFPQLMGAAAEVAPAPGEKRPAAPRPSGPPDAPRAAESLERSPLPRAPAPSRPAPKAAPRRTARKPAAPTVVSASDTDPLLAARLAPLVLKDLQAKSANYARPAMAEFQKAAGLAVDGDYGPRTAGALAYFTKQSVPPSFKKYRAAGQPIIVDYKLG